MSRTALVVLFAASLLLSAPAGAQLVPTLQLSSGLARRTPERIEPAIGLSPSIALQHGVLESWAGGTASRFVGGGLAADLEGEVSLTAPEWRCLRLSSTLEGEVHEYAGAGGSRRAELGARVGCRLSGGVAGGAGAAAVSARAPGAAVRAGKRLQLGAGLGGGARGVTISVTSVSFPGHPAVYRDTTVVGRIGNERVVRTGRILVRDAVLDDSRVDLAARAAWTHGLFGAELDFGARVGARDRRGERWASAALSYRVLPGVTLGAGYGATPSESEVGIDRGRRLILALRVTPDERRPVVQAPSPPPSAPRLRLQLVPIAPGLQTLRLEAPGARSVEIAGDFSDWTPHPLERAGDGWEATLHLEPGVYRLNVRLDGGPWVAPPGLPAEHDGFGGEVGVLAVPGAAPER